MKKIIPTLLTAAGCTTFTAFTAVPTFAAGAIGNAVDGVVDAGEDIADGIFRAGDDIADNLTGSGTSDLITPDNSSNSVNSNNSNNSDNSDIINSSSSGSNAIGDRNDISQSTPSAQNPTTGVTMGYAGATAVIAAMGVVVSSIHRKRS